METVRRLLLCFLVLFVSSAKLFSAPTLPLDRPNGEFSLFQENGKVGLKNDQGQIVIPAHYDELGWSDGTFSVVNNITGYRKNDLWGLLNVDTKRTSKAEFTDISFGAGSILVARKKIHGTIKIKAGAITTAGKEVIPFTYDGLSISSFRAIVYERSGSQFKKGLIDFENNVLIPLNYQSVYPLGSLRYAVENFENKTAIFSEDGKQITNFLIDSISSFKKNLAVFYQNQRQGVIDREGVIKVEPLYREIKINDDGSVDLRLADSWLMLDGENKLIHQVNADLIEPLTRDVFKLSLAGNYQLANDEFKLISEELFSSIGNFEKGKTIFRQGQREGMIDDKGTILIKPVYHKLILDGNSVLANQLINTKSRWTILDENGKSVTSQHYELILPFNGQFYPVKNRGHWGAVNSSGKEIIACAHDSIVDHKNQMVVVKFKRKFGIIDLREKWIVTPQNNPLQLVNDSLYFEKNSSTTFVKNFKGNIIYFSNNTLDLNGDYLIEHLANGSTQAIDFSGRLSQRLVQPESVEEVYPESEGFRRIKRNGSYGFVDNLGRLRIANRYEAAKEFSQGLAAIMIRGKWGFINKQDQIAIQPVYDEVKSFNENYAIVKKNNRFGLIDLKGKLILPVRYDSLVVNQSKTFLVKENGVWGLSDDNGRMIINPKYDNITALDNGYVIVERDGKFGLLTQQGLSTIPLMYDGLTFDEHHNRFVALKKSTWERKNP